MFTNVNSRLSILSEKNKKGGDVTPLPLTLCQMLICHSWQNASGLKGLMQTHSK